VAEPSIGNNEVSSITRFQEGDEAILLKMMIICERGRTPRVERYIHPPPPRPGSEEEMFGEE
jgi:hypothetical protein